MDYLDDLLIFANSQKKLLDIQESVLKTLIKAELKCKPRKCFLFHSSIEYLGHIISKDKVAPEPNKLEKVREWPFPTMGIVMASFLGFCSYYRRLIPHIAELSAPLYKVVQDSKIDQTSEIADSFKRLKELVCSTEIVRLPHPTQPFILETDASGVTVGAVLKQRNSAGEHPVSFYS